MKVANANTGASTLNVNSLGAKNILNPDASSLSSGQLASGSLVMVVYDGTQFILLGGSATQSYNGFKNRIINGAMAIDQRNAGASVTPTSGDYTLDRWVYQATQASKFSIQQNKGSITAPTGFTNYLGASVSSAVTNGAGDFFNLSQSIEGFNTADLNWGTANAKTVTLSFWVYSSLTGTFGGSLQNSAYNRSYPFSYSISSASTWTQISITIAGDTSGTWIGATNGAGVRLNFSLGTGTTYSGTAGAWAGTNYVGTTGAVSVVGTGSATFYITGVQLEKGSTATSFDYRPYGTELQLCQRYCFKLQTTSNYGPYGIGHGTGTTNFRAIIKYPVTMRAQPTLSFSAANTFQWSFGNVLTLIQAAEYAYDNCSIGCDTTGTATNSAYLLTSANNTTSYIQGSAEL
jgi:hypothetical protein